MSKLWHIFFAFVLLMVFVSAPSFASVGIQDDGTYVGEATSLNIVGETTATYDGTTKTINMGAATSYTTAGDMTFQSTLLAIGRVGASSTAASSSTNIYPQGLCYIAKAVGSGGGLDTTPGTHLGAGKKGQILVLTVTKLLTDGIWNIYPKDPITLAETSSVFTQIAMDTVKDNVMLLYVDSTIGWVVVNNDGATVTYKYWTSPGIATS